MLSNPEFEYRGTVYPSLKVCCEELGINKSSVINRLYMLRKKHSRKQTTIKFLYPLKKPVSLQDFLRKQ